GIGRRLHRGDAERRRRKARVLGTVEETLLGERDEVGDVLGEVVPREPLADGALQLGIVAYRHLVSCRLSQQRPPIASEGGAGRYSHVSLFSRLAAFRPEGGLLGAAPARSQPTLERVRL